MHKQKLKVLFIGTQNALPMHYALYFRERGLNVKYFVDVNNDDLLSRPEHQFSSIKYPYPEWIEEYPSKKPHLSAILPSFFFKKLIRLCFDYHAIIFDGLYVSIAAHLPQNILKIGLFAGADLDHLCDTNKANDLAKMGPFGKYAFVGIKRHLANKILQRNAIGLRSLNAICFFPKGLSQNGDRLINEVQKETNAIFVPRYHINPCILDGINSGIRNSSKKNYLDILCPVRFNFKNFGGGDCSQDKGNGQIIKALANFKSTNPNFKVHFFRKGPDAQLGEMMCKQLGLSENIFWHDPMPLPSLLELYEESDIVFDQVGQHWIGAVGIYAILLGKPLIANTKNKVLEQFLGIKLPIQNANTEKEILNALKYLSDFSNRKKISENLLLIDKDKFHVKWSAEPLIKIIEERIV